MKKLMAIGLAALSMGAFAAADDTLISFSTPGTDTYRDGSQVLDGECYALVYQAKGQTGAVTFSADGTASNGSIVLVAPLAKDGKCPPVVFEIDSAKFEREYKGGTFSVYLLDTRVKDGAAVTLAALDPTTHFPMVVNNTAVATESKTAEGQGNSLVATVAAGGAVSVATEVEAPTITSFKVDAGKVVITVGGMSPAATYKVVTGTTITGLSTQLDAEAKGETFMFEAPESGKFFKVIGEKNF